MIQERCKPQFDSTALAACLGAVLVLVGLALGAVFIARPELDRLAIALAALGPGLLFLLCGGSSVVGATRAIRSFGRRTIATQAVVLDRSDELECSEESVIEVHKVTLQFANGDRNVVLGAVVGEKLFDRLQAGAQVNVRYAKDDPRVCLIEGE